MHIKEFFKADTKVVLELIDELFAIEREATGGDDNDEALQKRARLRDVQSRPIIKKIELWANDVKTLPGNGLDGAINYMTNHWSGLTRFLNDPRIPLSDNITGRANRDPVLGRKNHYRSRSVRGTEVAPQLYTILETTKLNNVEAYAYLELAHECQGAVADLAALVG